jgi:hypothetical protein
VPHASSICPLPPTSAQGNVTLIRTYFDLGRIGAEEMAARIAAEEAIIRSLMDTTLEADFRTIEGVIERGEAPVTVAVKGGLPPLPRGPGEPELILKVQPPAPDVKKPWAPSHPDDEAEK